MTLPDHHLDVLADFVAGASLDDVPPSVLRGARLLLLDTLGALVGGLRYPQVRAAASALGAGSGVASGRPFVRITTLGTAATWLDADSGGSFHPQGHRLPPVPTAHPAPHVLPVLLHEAATRGIHDNRLLEVFVLATEVGLRVGVATSLRPGLHPHGVHGPGAAAVAAALVDGASAPVIRHALALGSSLPLAATLDVPVRGGTVRNLWTGLGAWYGTAAAQWASAGTVATPGEWSRLLDGAVCADSSVDDLTGALRERWEIVNSYLKPYACARWVHPALDAVETALAGVAVGPDDVESVDVETFAFAASLDTTTVRSDLQARFSVPWCVAALLLDGELHAASFLPDRLARPELREAAGRVRVAEDPDLTAALPRERPTRVVVRTRDGARHTGAVRNARGNPDHPLTVDEVAHKFRSNTHGLVPPALADEVIDTLVQGHGTVDVLSRVAHCAFDATGL